MGEKHERPLGLWVLGLILITNGIVGGWIFLQLLTGRPYLLPLPLSLVFQTGPIFDYAVTALMLGCCLVAGISLLLLSKRAVEFFAAAMVINVAYVIGTVLFWFGQAVWLGLREGASFSLMDGIFLGILLVGSGAGVAIYLAVLNYIRSLSEYGILE
ncbi:MAG TPA: hypothetical protein VGC27_06120 [Rhizomicrobium sp.]